MKLGERYGDITLDLFIKERILKFVTRFRSYSAKSIVNHLYTYSRRALGQMNANEKDI